MPIELAASAVGLTAFGLHLADVLNKYVSSFKDAENRMNAILYDTILITSVLQQFKEYVDEESEVHMSPQAQTIAKDAFDRCNRVFKDIFATLINGQPPEPSTDGTYASFQDVSKIAFRKRLAWPFLEPKLDLHRSNIDRIKTTLQLLMGVTTWGVLRKMCPDVSKVINQKEKEITALTEARRLAVKRADDLERKWKEQHRLPSSSAASEDTDALRATSFSHAINVTLNKSTPFLTPGQEPKAAPSPNTTQTGLRSISEDLGTEAAPGASQAAFAPMVMTAIATGSDEPTPPLERGFAPTSRSLGSGSNPFATGSSCIEEPIAPKVAAAHLSDRPRPKTSISSPPRAIRSRQKTGNPSPAGLKAPAGDSAFLYTVENTPVLKALSIALRGHYESQLELTDSLKEVFENALFKMYTSSPSAVPGGKPAWATPRTNMSLSDIAHAIDKADRQSQDLIDSLGDISGSQSRYRRYLKKYIDKNDAENGVTAEKLQQTELVFDLDASADMSTPQMPTVQGARPRYPSSTAMHTTNPVARGTSGALPARRDDRYASSSAINQDKPPMQSKQPKLTLQTGRDDPYLQPRDATKRSPTDEDLPSFEPLRSEAASSSVSHSRGFEMTLEELFPTEPIPAGGKPYAAVRGKAEGHKGGMRADYGYRSRPSSPECRPPLLQELVTHPRYMDHGVDKAISSPSASDLAKLEGAGFEYEMAAEDECEEPPDEVAEDGGPESEIAHERVETSRPDGPFFGHEGLVVTKKGFVSDGSGIVVGRVVGENMGRLVGMFVDEDGSVYDKYGNVQAVAEPAPGRGTDEAVNPSDPFFGLEGLPSTEDGDGAVEDATGNIDGRVVSDNSSKCVGMTSDEEGSAVDNHGSELGIAERWKAEEKQRLSPFPGLAAATEDGSLTAQDWGLRRNNDILIVKHKLDRYFVELPADSIESDVLRVRELRQKVAVKTGAPNVELVKILREGVELQDDGSSCKAVGLRNRSELLISHDGSIPVESSSDTEGEQRGSGRRRRYGNSRGRCKSTSLAPISGSQRMTVTTGAAIASPKGVLERSAVSSAKDLDGPTMRSEGQPPAYVSHSARLPAPPSTRETSRSWRMTCEVNYESESEGDYNTIISSSVEKDDVYLPNKSESSLSGIDNVMHGLRQHHPSQSSRVLTRSDKPGEAYGTIDTSETSSESSEDVPLRPTTQQQLKGYDFVDESDLERQFATEEAGFEGVDYDSRLEPPIRSDALDGSAEQLLAQLTDFYD